MKKTILSTVMVGLLCLSTSGYAKNIKQGTLEIGGSTGFNKGSQEIDPDIQNEKDTETNDIDFNVNTLYYVRPNIAIGGTWGYSSSETEKGNTKNEENINLFGPMISYNKSFTPQTSFKLQGAVMLLSSEDEEENTEFEGHSWIFTGMLSHFLNNNVSLNASAKYSFGEMEEKNTNIDTELSSFNFGLGISVYLDFDKLIR